MNIPEIYAPNAIEPALDILQGYLLDRANEIDGYSDSEFIQFSWVFLKILEIEGKLKIYSPEFGAMPIRFIEDSSDSINLVARQKYIADSFGVEGSGCNFRQTATVVKDIGQCSRVFMNRSWPKEGMGSGWFFGALDSALDVNDTANLEVRSLWELFCLFPSSGDFFLLPEGWQVMLDEKPIVLFDYEEADFIKDSFYDNKYNR